LPEPAKPKYLEDLLNDAVSKGAKVINESEGGGSLAGALFAPAVLYPVTPAMRVFTEEQFGPVVPIASFANVSEVHDAVRASWNGQQAAIFTKDPKAAAPLMDMLQPLLAVSI
jgi:glyceraldehyde-3-phosphate dehydrogenase (NADP+)